MSAPTLDIMSSLRATVRRNPNYVPVVADGRGADKVDNGDCKVSSPPSATTVPAAPACAAGNRVSQAAVACAQEKKSCAADSTTASTINDTAINAKRQLLNSNAAAVATNRQSIRGAAVTASGARDTLI